MVLCEHGGISLAEQAALAAEHMALALVVLEPTASANPTEWWMLQVTAAMEQSVSEFAAIPVVFVESHADCDLLKKWIACSQVTAELVCSISANHL